MFSVLYSALAIDLIAMVFTVSAIGVSLVECNRSRMSDSELLLFGLAIS